MKKNEVKSVPFYKLYLCSSYNANKWYEGETLEFDG